MAGRIQKCVVRIMACFLGAVGAIAAAPSAWAGAINIPAITFVSHGSTGEFVNGGFLQYFRDFVGTYYAPVPGLEPGQNVCKFIFWPLDNDTVFDVTARLVRKETASGSGVGFGPSPEVMASVATVGASSDTQKLVAAAITSPLVAVNFVYWVEIEFSGGSFPEGSFMGALSVRIVQQPVC